jgi:hypothetical protein
MGRILPKATCTALLAVTALLVARRAAAQATFYQVPSGDVTNAGDIYLQQQSTLTNRLDLTAQGMVGLAHHFDVGLSVYNFDLVRGGGRVRADANDTERSEPFGPLALASMQKRIDAIDGFGVLFGAQSGPNIAPADRMRIAVRGYANVVAEFGESRRCSAGAYLANGIFVGGASVQIAPWAGCDIEVLDEALEIQADWDFGAHANGAATLGPQLRLGKHVGIAPAVRIPNPWADQAKWGGVLQFEVKDPLL